MGGTRYPFIESILKEYTKPGMKVLEIGAGGAVYRDLFTDYVGTDLASTPYAKAGDIAAYCDGQQIPFKSESFDMAFIVAALYQIPDTDKVMSEIHRVLKAGGIFIIFDYNDKRTQYLKEHENDGINQNHVWTQKQLKTLVQKHEFQAIIINHWRYFPSSGNSFKDNLFRNRISSKLRCNIFKDWNVIIGEKK
ncbi:MAG TPA: hypothetical protein DCY35_11820 [Prolixibacteraceae bacterium]|nr:hypothetical protein [Prolixibacteraceae bacterium]